MNRAGPRHKKGGLLTSGGGKIIESRMNLGAVRCSGLGTGPGPQVVYLGTLASFREEQAGGVSGPFSKKEKWRRGLPLSSEGKTEMRELTSLWVARLPRAAFVEGGSREGKSGKVVEP